MMPAPLKSSTSMTSRFPQGECGMVMMYVIYVMLALALFLTAAIALMGNATNRSRRELAYHGQAGNVARAGLQDAVNWFKGQSVQPVRSNGSVYVYPDAAFDPKHSNDPKLNFTDDETVGLVKEFPLNDNETLWGRYELARQQVNNASNESLTQAGAIRDISGKLGKGYAGDGLAWHLESTGLVYLKNDANKSYNQAPNRVLERITMAEQILALTIKRPVESAVISGNAAQTNLGTNARVTGMPNSYALAYKKGTGNPTPATAPSTCTGKPSAYLQVPDSLWFDDVYSVFGVSQSELKSMSNLVVTNVNQLPSTMPSMAIIYIDGNANFDSSRPLAGGGILFVNGNLTIATNSNSLYSGFIYCVGKVTQSSPSLISGMIIARGGYASSGSNDVAQAEYSSTILNTVRDHLCQYQEAKAPYVVLR